MTYNVFGGTLNLAQFNYCWVDQLNREKMYKLRVAARPIA